MENFDILLKKICRFHRPGGREPPAGPDPHHQLLPRGRPLARLCVRSAYEAGARDVLVNWSDNDVSRSRMELGSEEALTDFKSWQLRRYLDYAESEGGVCVLHIHADDPEVYAGLDGAKISRVNAGQRKFMAPWREYTMNDRVQWSIAAMPSAPWAKKMFPELDEAAAIEKLWKLIFDVCRVTNGDPVNEWKAHLDRLTDLKNKMNALDLESVHFESANGTDLTVGIADKATWESAASVSEKGVVFLPNIPTEEVFTAPHKDKVDGIVYGTKPYVFNGQLIKGFHVTFKDGRVVEHGAEEGAELLGQLLDTDEGARSIGEVALVPASSPINRSGALFYSTLFRRERRLPHRLWCQLPRHHRERHPPDEGRAAGPGHEPVHHPRGCDGRCRGQPYHRQMPRRPHRGAVPRTACGCCKSPVRRRFFTKKLA